MKQSKVANSRYFYKINDIISSNKNHLRAHPRLPGRRLSQFIRQMTNVMAFGERSWKLQNAPPHRFK